MPVRRRKTSTTATEGTAEPDCRLTELQAEPDVRTDLAEESENSDTSVIENWAKADMAVPEDVVITIADNGGTQGNTNTGTMATPTVVPAPTMDFFQKSGVSSEQQVNSLGPGLEASQDRVSPQAMATGPPQPLRPAQCGTKGSTSWQKLGKLLPSTAPQVFPMPLPGASHGKGHSPESGIPCTCGCQAAHEHSEVG